MTRLGPFSQSISPELGFSVNDEKYLYCIISSLRWHGIWRLEVQLSPCIRNLRLIILLLTKNIYFIPIQSDCRCRVPSAERRQISNYIDRISIFANIIDRKCEVVDNGASLHLWNFLSELLVISQNFISV